MAQYWTRKHDQDDLDEKTATPWAQSVGHGNTYRPDPKDEEQADGKG